MACSSLGLHAQVPARVEVERAVLLPRSFTAGQQGARVELTVRNTGGSAARLETPSLDFGGRAGDFTVTPDPSNPTTLAATSSAVLTLSVDVSSAAETGYVRITSTLGAADDPTGQPAAVGQAPAIATRVRAGPDFVVFDVSSSPGRVSQGQSSRAEVNVQAGSRDAWSAQVLSPSPPARTEAAAVFDSARDRVVFFGGQGVFVLLADTWEWDGSAWQSIEPASSPPARRGHAMAYDEAARQVVLFGGSSGAALFGDTWIYDGTSWRQEVATDSPAARTRHGMASLAGEGGVLLFGGSGSSGLLGDTWRHEQDRWVRVTSADGGTDFPPPAPRSGHGMVLEPRFDEVLLHGGETTTGTTAETWIFDGEVWQQLEDTADFGTRRGFAIASDPIARQVLLFGGEDAQGLHPDNLWAWSGIAWTEREDRIEPGGTAPGGPTGRSGAALVFDGLTSQAVLFGGQDASSTILGDTWSRLSQPEGRDITATVQFLGDEGAYTVSADPGNPARLAQGETFTFDFPVRVASTAQLGPRTFLVRVAARDAETGAPARVSGSGSGSWTVEEPASLEVAAIRFVPAAAAPGTRGVRLEADVSNAGAQPHRAAAEGVVVTPVFDIGRTPPALTPLANNPVQVSGDTTETFAFTFDLDPNEPIGFLEAGLAVSGTDANSLEPAEVNTALRGHLFVGFPPPIQAGPVTVTPSTVVQGTDGVRVTVPVRNESSGRASAVESLEADLSLSPGSLSFRVTRASTNVTALGVGESAIMTLTLDVGDGAPAGEVIVSAVLEGRDSATGGPLELTGATTAVLQVLRPARLTVRGITIRPQLSTGQFGVPVEVAVAHPEPAGLGSALEDIQVGLTFNESLEGFSVSTAASNVTSLAAGASAILSFTVDLTEDAPLGNVRVAARASARDALSGEDATVDTSAFADSVVKLPAGLLVQDVTLSPATARQGQFGIEARVTVRNTGPAGSGAEAGGMVLGFELTPAAAGFDVRPAPRNLTRLAGGATALLTATLDVGASVSIGAYSVRPVLTALDTGSGVAASVVATATAGLEVLGAPELTVQVAPVAAPVSRSESFEVTASVQNGGSAAAVLRSGSLVFDLPGLTVSAPAGLPVTVSPGGAATLAFPVSVSPAATGGQARGVVTVSAEGVAGVAGSGTVLVDVSAPPPPPDPVPPVARIRLLTPQREGPRILRFDGSGSLDLDGEAIAAYSWVLESAPEGAPLPSTTSPELSFEAFLPGVYGVLLEVQSRAGLRGSARTTAEVLDVPPVASAGPGLSVLLPGAVGQTPGSTLSVRLDASGSADPNRTEVTYEWTIRRAPDRSDEAAESTALVRFDSRTVSRPVITFTTGTVDGNPASALRAVGRYLFQVAVGDGASVTTASVEVVTQQPPRPPRAVIRLPGELEGPPRRITLDAEGTDDPDGDPIVSHAWRLERGPAGAAPATASATVFSYDAFLPGLYEFRLDVEDSTGLTGTATAGLTVQDVPPLADAGTDRSFTLPSPGAPATSGATLAITLDGTGSRDANRTDLTYSWRVLSAPDQPGATSPASSLVQLLESTSATPVASFVSGTVDGKPLSRLRATGTYFFGLQVGDGTSLATDTVRVDALDPLDPPPTADAGLDRAVVVTFQESGGIASTLADPLAPGQPVDFIRLDGRESSDPRERPLRYAWRPVEVPAGSALDRVTGATTPFPTFQPDVAGRYRFELRVESGSAGFTTDVVTIDVRSESGNRPPLAVAVVRDEVRGIATSLSVPVLEVETGSVVTLDAEGSTDMDVSDRESLTYLWTSEVGPSVAFTPSATAQRVSFTPSEAGGYRLRLTVTDTGGARDEAGVRVRARARGAARGAVLSLSASAKGLPDGEAVPVGGFQFGPSRSLRVTAPATVTLTGRLDPGDPVVGDAFDYLWRQIAGPAVLLSAPGESGTTRLESVTRFVPTTSRVHEFELTVTPVDGGVRRPFLAESRRIRVVVDTARASVPTAVLTTHVVVVAAPAAGAPDMDRRVTLDASASLAASSLPEGGRFTVLWRQVFGPPGTIADPFALRTSFTLPDLGAEGVGREYVIELTVDVTPPGDRSEPVFLLLSSGEAAPAPQPGGGGDGGGGGGGTGGSVPGGGGGGCALASPTGEGRDETRGPAILLLLVLTPLAISRARTRMGPWRRADSEER